MGQSREGLSKQRRQSWKQNEQLSMACLKDQGTDVLDPAS